MGLEKVFRGPGGLEEKVPPPPTYFCLLPCYWYSTTQATRNRAGDIGLEEVFRGPGGLEERVPPPGTYFYVLV